MASLSEQNQKLRSQLGHCLVQNEKNEQNLDKISDAVEFTINRCKVKYVSNLSLIDPIPHKDYGSRFKRSVSFRNDF